MFSFQGTSSNHFFKRFSETSNSFGISINLFILHSAFCILHLRSGGPGLAFLRESHGGCNSPPDCCQEPPFESILALRHPGAQKFSVLASVSLVFEVVGQNGLEPSTSRLSVVCSSQLSYWPIPFFLVESTGIEPVTSCLQGRRSPS